MVEATSAAPDLGAAVTLLGADASYLRTDAGRRAAREILKKAGDAPPETALAATQRMLEAAMKGPLQRADAAQRTAVDELRTRHHQLVRRVVFDPANAARARRHVVEAGESLDRIAGTFRQQGVALEAGTLALVNRIDDPRRLRAGQSLRIPVDPVRCVVWKSSFLMAVYLGDQLVRAYWVAHGSDGHDTPETSFEVAEKIRNPDWHHDGDVIPFGDPRNPLGSWFVKFRHASYAGFGAHGTSDPESVGTKASLGCIRLLPEDIDEFARFVPRGATVEVR
jgi:hypothetical protein